MDESGREPRFHGDVSERSHKNMSRIRGSGTGIEVMLRKALWKKGYRYRKNMKGLPGRPDIALTKYKLAIFCDSEFFHGKDWDTLEKKLENGRNPDYWIPKIRRNMERDRDKDSALRGAGWTVIHFWGKDITKDVDACVAAIEEIIFEQKINADGDT